MSRRETGLRRKNLFNRQTRKPNNANGCLERVSSKYTKIALLYARTGEFEPFDSAAGLLLDDGCLVIQPKVMRQTSALLQEKMNYSSLAGWTHQNRADTELLKSVSRMTPRKDEDAWGM